MTNNELDIYPTVEGMDLTAPCDTCLYKKNCVFIERHHKAIPKIVGCTGWESDDVEPVRHSRWVKAFKNNEAYFRCPECGTYIEATFFANDYAVNYCPTCAAKMDLKAQ